MTTPTNSPNGLNDLDREIRRHINRLLEIDVGNGDSSNLIYDAVQNAARLGQEVQRRQRALASETTPE